MLSIQPISINDRAPQIQRAAGKGAACGPPPDILAQLQQYGLSPTGSLQGDLQAIEAAKTQLAQEAQGSQEEQSTPQPYNTNFLSDETKQNFLRKNNLL